MRHNRVPVNALLFSVSIVITPYQGVLLCGKKSMLEAYLTFRLRQVMWTRGQVIERIDWAISYFHCIAAELAPFIPGQFIKLSQMQDDKRVARAYS